MAEANTPANPAVSIVVPVRATCEALVPMLRRLAGDQVTVRMACDTDASIRMDAGQLEQVLFNLVLNSRDAMSDGGEIEIRTEETAGEDGHATVGLVVSDTGTGMDADTLARCREPFFTTKGRRGIGLGLAGSREIVRQMGGDIEVSSQEGKGSTFTVKLPAGRLESHKLKR